MSMIKDMYRNTMDTLGTMNSGATKGFLILMPNDSLNKLKSSEVATVTEQMLQYSTGGQMNYSPNETPQIFQIQYNPATLSIAGRKMNRKKDQLQQGDKTDAIKNKHITSNVELSVELFFDAMSPANCFLTTFSASYAYSNYSALRVPAQGVLAKFGMSTELTEGTSYRNSVQAETNGLLTALLKGNRCIVFKWADMTFCGELSNVQGKYTMFSDSGLPVRAVVQLTLVEKKDSNNVDDYLEQLKKIFH